jgi:hypothetical protein
MTMIYNGLWRPTPYRKALADLPFYVAAASKAQYYLTFRSIRLVVPMVCFAGSDARVKRHGIANRASNEKLDTDQ